MRPVLLLSVSLPLLLGGCNQSSSVLKYEIHGDAVTITGCDEDASGELVIPNAIKGKPVTSIGGGAFSDCISLTGITIPDGVTSIGNYAFYYCTNLTSITIPDSVTSIGDAAFSGCSALTTIEVAAENVNYTEVNGVLFDTEMTLLHTYPAGKTGASYTIPHSVTSIEAGAFQYCTSLTNITIPDSVTSIGWGAFAKCTNLTGITIPDSVTSIGEGAFGYCRSLTSITIPDSVPSIGDGSFFGCSSLRIITIGNGVTSIGTDAFARNRSLTAVTFLGDAPKAARTVFSRGATHTIYRKPEAKGWGETWGGMPVKLISEKP